MPYKSFEDLPVWNAAVDLAARTFAMTAKGGLNAYAGLKNQIERAVVSVSNNIAEGFERGTYEELLTFLYYALGSTGEVRSMPLLVQRVPGGDALRPHTEAILPMTRNVSRQFNGWVESLKNSTNRGPRHQNASTRDARERAQRGKAFLEELERLKQRARDAKDQDPQEPQDPQPATDP